MKTHLKALAAGAFALGGAALAASPASAVTYPPSTPAGDRLTYADVFGFAGTPGDGNRSCLVSSLGGATDCDGIFAGNDDNQNLDELFLKTGWTELYKVDDDSGTDGPLTVSVATANDDGEGVTGSWSITGGFDASLGGAMIVLKGGPSFSAFFMDLTATGGSWDTQSLVDGDGKRGPGLSHFTVYTTTDGASVTQPIPLPAGVLLILTALAGAGVVSRVGRKAA